MCSRPPRGWYCKLEEGHEGSCPTHARWWMALLVKLRWWLGSRDPEDDQHYYTRWSPLLLFWRIRHRLTGPQRGCSCTRCFNHPRRRVPAREIYEVRRRLHHLEDKVAARKYPKLIVASSHRQGELAARNLGLRTKEWVVKQTADSLRGYSGEVEVYIVHPFLNMRPSFQEALDEVRRLEAKGATVRSVTT